MNSVKINIKENKINNQGEEIKEDEKKLLNILTNKNLFNDKKTKIVFKKDYIFLIKIFHNSDDTEFINLFNYLNEINIPILKILIFGFIEFDIENNNTINENIMLEIITKGININFNKNIFYFIYKKLSKKFRRNYSFKNMLEIKKFAKLFEVWKILYNTINPKYNNELIKLSGFYSYFNINEEKKFIEIDIKDKNPIKNLIIIIKLFNSPILNINKIIDNFFFMKLCDEKDEIFELKYSDLIGQNEKIKSFSKIFKIKCDFSQKGYNIYINKELYFSSKEEMKINLNSIKKMEILNNFYGSISYVKIRKIYEIVYNDDDSFSISKPVLNMKIFKDKNKIEIKTNANELPIKEKENIFEKEENSYLYEYHAGSIVSISLKIFYEIIEYNEHLIKGKINLNKIEYIGGLNCFIPLFKIIKYIIDNLLFITNNTNVKNEEDKLKLQSDINEYLDKSFGWIKDILKIILKIICLSEKNYKSLKEVIVPLIGSLAEISHSLNILCDSKLITNDRISLFFHDEVFSSLYIILLISPFPFNIKEMYRKIIRIDKNLDNLNISLDCIVDIEKENIKNMNWYFTILVIYIEFIFIYFNSYKKVPYKLINLITFFLTKYDNETNDDAIKKKEAIKVLSNIINNFYNEEKENKSEKIIEDKTFINDNNYYFQFIIYMLTSFLNIKLIIKRNNIEFSKNSFYDKFLNFIEDYFRKKEKINITDDYAQMIINFKFYPKEISFLQQLFPFLSQENFDSENNLIMEELVDYHGQYHHLMKELFIFNKLWSNQKLFFNTSFDKIKKSKLKYKNINYYTRNFQRPIIYPVLDYKYRYPEFSNFKINKDFYSLEEDNDDYNFDLDCPELDQYTEEYDKDIFKIIEKNGKINTCGVCLVKQTHHVKGILFIFYDDDKIIIYFYSYSYRLQNNEDEILCCNKGNEEEINIKEKNNNINNINSKNNLCYGSIFKCPKKDANKIIRIKLDDIRLVLSRIYFYRNSALEIFTETKSYYFNFESEDKKQSLICTFMYPCEESFFPINIDGNVIGYMKLNQKIINKNKFSDLINKNNNFIDFISDQTSKGELCEMCIFDIIMLINLISNRSFNDLYQYPIFPILYLYDKKNHKIIDRDFKEHIGFQDFAEKSKTRKNLFQKTYQETINELNEKGFNENEENNENLTLNYFNTHYSNSIYTSNYLIRLFPYSFSAIELQGKGFDHPNRLFHSIEDTLNNISSQKSDLRELIPEFFYLPEMFMNINSINFSQRTNKELVDDVIMPKKLPIKNKSISYNNNIEYNEMLYNDFNVVMTDNSSSKKENFKKCFIFIEDMKNKLENLTKDLGLWINIIFGLNQKYNSKNQQYFRSESYINFNNKYKNYLKDNFVMNSVEFGIIPLQTIFDNKILSNLQKRRSSEYEKHEHKGINILNMRIKKNKDKDKDNINNISDEEYEILEKSDRKLSDRKLSDKKVEKYFNNEFNDYWDEQLNIDFKINNKDNFGKLKIFKDNILISEIFDHNDIIIDFFYNRRLNMFATTSYDGYICVYILPNKLFCIIKHPKINSYYDKIYLSANPFPTIIGYEKEDNILTAFSLSGLVIKRVKIIKSEEKSEEKIKEIKIKPKFNIYGGAFKDKLKIIFKYEKSVKNEYFNLPFFDIENKKNLN